MFASDEWCPYVCFESTRPGFLVELVREVFESPARPVEIRRMSWARAVREAEGGRIDGVLGAVRGESAALVYPKLAAASDRPAFAVRADDPWRFTGVEVLADRRIGLADGYRFGPTLDGALFPGGSSGPTLETLSSDRPTWTNLRKLVDRRIDTVLDNGHVLRHEIDRSGFFPAVRLIDAGVENPIFIAFADSPAGRSLAQHFDRAMLARSERGGRSDLEQTYGPMGSSP
ncbi:transporter substrate-binding domain-containing protein [Silanimonas sp.]|uniref:substrate-binding periplasmic protein n=1 Tax=Silanimonas sp. TaxID=1929290 RepID=UPI0022BDC0A2|nr:transporter substrate-binding domain-containing protein [Silanimonas sp.]MCZ8165234.1 transporter substrate-binding domain-containing protein [Silanimonas sp.]